MIVILAAVAGCLLGILLGGWLIPWRPRSGRYYPQLDDTVLDWNWPPPPGREA